MSNLYSQEDVQQELASMGAELNRLGITNNLGRSRSAGSENVPVKEDTKQTIADGYTDKVIHNNRTSAKESPSASSASIYAGDIEDESGPIKDNKWQTLDFRLSSQLVSFFNPAISSGSMSLHQWQKDISFELCWPDTPATAKHPLKYCLIAANGSGKDAFVIAPFVVWFACSKIRSLTIITSSSGSQLQAQTENYIRSLCQAINEQTGFEVFRIRQRFIKCLLSGSEIRLFATDEEGKAEGYHPLEPNREMLIVVNEGKSVTDEIHQALKRCTGFNYWLEVSSPGEPKGYCYSAATTWRYTRRVSYVDCPHLSDDEREEDKVLYGENSAYYRSKWLALFTSTGGETIIPRELLDRLLQFPPNVTGFEAWPIRVGIDLSKGKDEIVLCFTKGNKCLKEIPFRETDTTITADRIDRYLMDILQCPDRKYEFIFADDGGIGGAIIDMLVRKGWINIKRIHNQSPAINKRHFGNRGAEAWDRVKRFFEEGIFDPTGLTDKTIDQLTSRKTKDKLTGAKVYLQSKQEAKAHGFDSPDRADAFILSLTGLTIEDYLKIAKQGSENGSGSSKSQIRGGIKLGSSSEEVEQNYANVATYKEYEDALKVANKILSSNVNRHGARAYASLSTAIRRGNRRN